MARFHDFQDFGSKNEMRRLLSLKNAYSSRTEYSRIAHMPFGQIKVFWQRHDGESKDMLLKSAKASTQVGAKEWGCIKNTVNTYKPTAPMGSQDPTMPIDMKDLESKIIGTDDALRVRCERGISTIGHRRKGIMLIHIRNRIVLLQQLPESDSRVEVSSLYDPQGQISAHAEEIPRRNQKLLRPSVHCATCLRVLGK